jgi:hypothetical protein
LRVLTRQRRLPTRLPLRCLLQQEIDAAMIAVPGSLATAAGASQLRTRSSSQVLETIEAGATLFDRATRHAACSMKSMPSWRLERERPSEWLRWLAEEPDAYQVLLEQAGGLARAAYRLASARCRARGDVGETPTLRELQAAALVMAGQLGLTESLPIGSMLANECEAQGLLVIRPMLTPSPRRDSSVPPLRRAS